MKKLILFLIVGIFLINFVYFVYAEENCELALPRYGIVECFNMGQQETKSILMQASGDSSVGSVSCLSNCKLNTMTDIPQISCGASWGVHIEIKVNGVVKYQESSTESRRDRTIEFNRGQELTIFGYCRGLLGGKSSWPSTTITYKQDLIMLKEGWAGSLPTTTIPSTEGCTLNSVLDRYRGDTEVSSFFSPVSGQSESKPPSTFSSTSSMPSNWEIGQNYIFVKDWQTGIADISLAYDKNNKGYWCGGLTGSRKIYSVNQINSNTGKCYSIPTSIYLSNVECCFPSDCSYKGTKYTCNPDNWKCEETKPCNSQLECDQTFGEGICQNSQITKWTCDTNKKWGSYAGTCTASQRNVQQCPSDCTSEEYYDEAEGKCKPRVVILDCPPGKCCTGGNYKLTSCLEGLQCCTNGGYVGDCKDSCEPVKSSSNTNSPAKSSGLTGAAIGTSGRFNLKYLWFGLGILLVVGLIVGALVMSKRKQSSSAHLEDGEKCPSCGNMNKKGIKHCVSCGNKLDKYDGVRCKKCGSSNSITKKFCTNCGEKL